MLPLKDVQNFIFNKLGNELPGYLTYHSLEHVQDVYDCCQSMAALEGVKGEDLDLLLTAALFHDVGFTVQANEHEEVSCDMAREHLPRFGYSTAQIERICGMIMATRIPQKPRNKLEEILADADLDYLGREDFYTISDTLFRELAHYGIVNTKHDWNKMQVRFLENHHYFTPYAIKKRKAAKEKHLAELKAEIEQ